MYKRQLVINIIMSDVCHVVMDIPSVLRIHVTRYHVTLQIVYIVQVQLYVDNVIVDIIGVLGNLVVWMVPVWCANLELRVHILINVIVNVRLSVMWRKLLVIRQCGVFLILILILMDQAIINYIYILIVTPKLFLSYLHLQ